MKEVLISVTSNSGTGLQEETEGSPPGGDQRNNCGLLIARVNRLLTAIIEPVKGQDILDVKFWPAIRKAVKTVSSE